MNNSTPLEKELHTSLFRLFRGFFWVSQFFPYEHVLLLESEEKKKRIKKKRDREYELIKTYSFPSRDDVPSYGDFPSTEHSLPRVTTSGWT